MHRKASAKNSSKFNKFFAKWSENNTYYSARSRWTKQQHSAIGLKKSPSSNFDVSLVWSVQGPVLTAVHQNRDCHYLIKLNLSWYCVFPSKVLLVVPHIIWNIYFVIGFLPLTLRNIAPFVIKISHLLNCFSIYNYFGSHMSFPLEIILKNNSIRLSNFQLHSFVL